MTRKWIAGLLCAVLALCAAGCGAGPADSQPADPVWKTDVKVEDLCQAVKDATSLPMSFLLVGPSVIMVETDLDLDLCIEAAMYRTSDTLDEFGVFLAKDEACAAQVEQTLTDYLKRRNDEWTGQYMVDEYPKLEKAQVKRDGLYVCYLILAEQERAAAFDAFDALLKG